MAVQEAREGALPIVGKPAAAGNGESGVEDQRAFRPDIYWYLSFRCNLACAHCSVRSSPRVDTSDDLDTADCLAVVKQMAELNVRVAMVSGGEVLYRPDALIIMEELGRHGIITGLETNGLLFKPAFFELAKRLQSQGLFRMNVSVDGGTAETHERIRGKGTFDRTIENLHALKEHSIVTSMQCVLNNENFRTIPNLFEHARELYPNIGVLQFALLNPVGRGNKLIQKLGLKWEHMQEILAMLAHEMKTYEGTMSLKTPPATIPPRYQWLVQQSPNMLNCMSCQFPLLGVLPNGDVTICALSRDNQSLYYGNVRETELKQVWLNTRMEMLRSNYVAADDLTGICGDCVWKKMCRGSCRAWAYEEGGDFNSPFPICTSLDEAGRFPDVYRISKQTAAFGANAASSPLLSGSSCGCVTA